MSTERRHASDRPRARPGPLARAARAAAAGLAAAALAGTFAGALAGCRGETPRNPTVERRRAAPPAEAAPDTGGSLVTALVADSLGGPRAVGTVVTLREECASCHPAAHDVPLGRGPSAAASCEACHADEHRPIQALYAGELRDSTVRPDTMFVARVACAGCHADTTFAAPEGAPRLAAIDRTCTQCHGERFAGMLARWDRGVAWRTQAVAAYVQRAAADPRLAAQPASRERVRAAQQTVELLRTAGALHNILGADRLFRSTVAGVAAAYARAGVAAPARPALGPAAAGESCLACHYGVETARDTVFGETFDHGSHLVRAGVACSKCHSDADYFVPGTGALEVTGTTTVRGSPAVDPRHGKTRLTAASCNDCHHAPSATLTCASCHTGDARLGRPLRVTMAMRLQPKEAPASREVSFSHAEHASTSCASCHTSPTNVRATATCASCHTDHHRAETQACASCHGADARKAHANDDHLACTSCHARETVARLTPNRAFCVSCHADQAKHKPGRECSTCHMQSTPAALQRKILATSR